MAKVVTSVEVVAKIKNGSKIAISGHPEFLIKTLGCVFKATNWPRNLTFLFSDTLCEDKERDWNILSQEGLVKQLSYGHIGLTPNQEKSMFKHKTDVAFIQGMVADAKGNVSFDLNTDTLETLVTAQAAKDSGGIVVAQVERIVHAETILPTDGMVPASLIDYIVLRIPQEYHIVEYKS